MKILFEYFEDYDEEKDVEYSESEINDKETEEEEEEEKTPHFIEGEKDPVRIYLKEMSNVPLLTREGEIQIAKKIEDGRERIYGIIFLLPFSLKKLITLGRMVRSGEAPIAEIIQNSEEDTEEDLLLERKRFFEITKEIDCLIKKIRSSFNKLKGASSLNPKKALKKKSI